MSSSGSVISEPSTIWIPDGLDLKDIETGTVVEYDNLDYNADTPDEDGSWDDNSDNSDQIRHVFKDIPFDQLAETWQPVDEEKTVFKEVIRPGSGSLLAEDDVLTIHYNGYIEGRKEPFDSTYLRKKPLKVRLGEESGLLPGMEIAVSSMLPFEESYFLLKPEVGFGKMGVGDRIPGDAILLFQILLLCRESGVDIDLEPTEDGPSNFEKRLARSMKDREMGNTRFSRKDYNGAIKCYERALRVIENVNLANDDEDIRYRRNVVKICNNLAMSYVKMGRPKDAGRGIQYTHKALEFDRTNAKTFYLKGSMKLILEDFDAARRALERSLELKPGDKAVLQKLELVDEKEREHEEKLKAMESAVNNFNKISLENENQTKNASEPSGPPQDG